MLLSVLGSCRNLNNSDRGTDGPLTKRVSYTSPSSVPLLPVRCTVIKSFHQRRVCAYLEERKPKKKSREVRSYLRVLWDLSLRSDTHSSHDPLHRPTERLVGRAPVSGATGRGRSWEDRTLSVQPESFRGFPARPKATESRSDTPSRSRLVSTSGRRGIP